MTKSFVITAALTLQAAVALAVPAGVRTQGTKVFFKDGNKVSCSLPAGESTVIVALPQPVRSDRVILVNENWAARGHFQIAIAKEKLAATSTSWTIVKGAVAFDHKRLISVSVLGTEARYLRLQFQIERERSGSSDRQS